MPTSRPLSTDPQRLYDGENADETAEGWPAGTCHHAERGQQTRQGPAGLGFVLVVPTTDLDATWRLWREEGLTVTLDPEDVGWARIFYGLDPDGYEVMFEQFPG
ncbi:VOC family protein [Salinispora sp. H7-4]|uniref:VOC family protein n=1 Tax=Salinispora sp. H7-4 TaxID=2748321 RepID=UPI002815AF3E|nr:VOC family protein [Salinispora sp. H7-4]